MLDQHVAIVGAGTMGRTIATAIVKSGTVAAPRIRVSDHSAERTQALHDALGVAATQNNAEACREADIVLLCVKPHDIANVMQELRSANALWPRALVISIAAGVTTTTIERAMGERIAVVRAMPNTPCLVNQGMTVLAAGQHATTQHLAIAHDIFATMGRCLTLAEKHMDVVTGLSGSGPAFMYVILDALADGGVMCGLPRTIATELAAQVALGASTMILSTGAHPSALKDDVTTPGGCTIAGLLALEDGKIRSVLARAVETAAATARQLGAPATVA